MLGLANSAQRSQQIRKLRIGFLRGTIDQRDLAYRLHQLGAVLLAKLGSDFTPDLGFGDRQLDLDQLMVFQRAFEFQMHSLRKTFFGHGYHGIELMADGSQLFSAGGI